MEVDDGKEVHSKLKLSSTRTLCKASLCPMGTLLKFGSNVFTQPVIVRQQPEQTLKLTKQLSLAMKLLI